MGLEDPQLTDSGDLWLLKRGVRMELDTRGGERERI